MTAETAIYQPVSSLQSKTRIALLVVLTALLCSGNASAIEQIDIELGKLSGAGWSLEGGIMRLSWGANKAMSLHVQGNKLSHPLLSAPLETFLLECPQSEISSEKISCSGGNFTANLSTKKDLSFPLDLETVSTDDTWQLHLDAKAVDLRLVQKLFPLASGTKLKGKIDLSLKMAGSADEGDSTAVDWNTRMRNLSFSDATGEYLGEGLYGRWQGSAKSSGEGWGGSQKVQLQKGAILAPALFIDPEGHQINLGLDFNWTDESNKLIIKNLDYRHQGILTAHASATIDFKNTAKLQRVRLKSSEADLPAIYTAYLQPVMAGTLLENLELAGKGALELELGRSGQHRVDLHFSDMFMEDVAGRFAVYGLDGQLIVTNRRKAETSHLSWKGGHLLGGLKTGKSSAVLQLKDGGVELKEPLLLPVLDGSLQVDRFSLVQAKDGPKVQFSGSVAPISMQAISQALDWPPLAGELSGVIPAVSYEKGEIVVDGEMLIRLFSGDVKINNLYLEDLFGALPRVKADVDFTGLDLDTLTRTFSFGKITGKLQGYIHKLYLEAWRPISFNARLETPPDDDSKHRISQRAVENISNLGGVGVSGAISRTFLRMFKEFGYSRLGISCRLQQGVCAMGGIEPAESGYYIVRGGGVPRIDIIGFNQNIDWEILVTKLKDISRNPDPIIQ